MKFKLIAAALVTAASPAFAGIRTTGTFRSDAPVATPTVATQPQEATPASSARWMREGTMVVVTPSQEVSSKHVKEGEQYRFQVVNDVVEGQSVVIPRGSTVVSTVMWKTGRAVGGKSGKFQLSFDSVTVQGKAYKLTGTWRQEGRGNSVGALLGSMVISGRSAVMLPGELVNVFTAQPIPY